ncbi:MAG: hypothetical protein KJ726_09840 [Verrucomicrobia bacterium]|nr:hypothetical protein [Verrucomicrobiota bacterium]MBU1910337.1 hypothetical protein [Verrucomicrobiota bacterium]
MPKILTILLGTQLLYSASDFMGRAYMGRHGFKAATFLSLWFLAYQVIRQVAMFGQLYLFAHVPLGKTMAMLGAASIVFSNLLGWLLLGEVLSPASYAGVFLAVTAILIMIAR